MKNKFLDSKQVANMLRISWPTLHKIIVKGELKPLGSVSGMYLFRLKDVQEFKKHYKKSTKGRKRKTTFKNRKGVTS